MSPSQVTDKNDFFLIMKGKGLLEMTNCFQFYLNQTTVCYPLFLTRMKTSKIHLKMWITYKDAYFTKRGDSKFKGVGKT